MIRFLTLFTCLSAACISPDRPSQGDGFIRIVPQYPQSNYQPGGQPISLELMDARQGDKQILGQNERSQTPVIAGKPGAGMAMVWDGFRTELAKRGFTAQYPTQEGTVILRVYLNQLWVSENRSYQGDAYARIDVVAPGNQVTFSSEKQGTVSTWGRYSRTRDYENALTGAVEKLFSETWQSPGFQDALRGTNVTYGQGVAPQPEQGVPSQPQQGIPSQPEQPVGVTPEDPFDAPSPEVAPGVPQAPASETPPAPTVPAGPIDPTAP